MLCSVAGWLRPSGAWLIVAKRRRDDPQPCWRCVLPSARPVSRRRFARLAGDLIEACVPLPDTALSRPVAQSMRGGYVTWWTVAIGVDTHKQWHVAVALDRLGAQIDCLTVETTMVGYQRLLSWACRLGQPVFGIEGCGSYGAGLARFLAGKGVAVYECERPKRGERRGGKNDLIDATLAARRVVIGEGLSLPRGDGRREQLRVLLLERRGATRARTAALNQLDAVIVTAPDDLRRRLAGLPKKRLVPSAARLRSRPDGVTDVLRRIARRIEALGDEITQIDDPLRQLVAEMAPHLLAECGVGAVCAAQLIVSSGDPKRMASEASFAALAGASPVDASSGKQQRHRLNRGGDRQLNWALHVIALQRVHHHTETADYYQRLLAAGKSTKQAKRCIKRALARHFYHQLRSPILTT
jgi:transposase